MLEDGIRITVPRQCRLRRPNAKGVPYQRREWDSNPRRLAPHGFSSATLGVQLVESSSSELGVLGCKSGASTPVSHNFPDFMAPIMAKKQLSLRKRRANSMLTTFSAVGPNARGECSDKPRTGRYGFGRVRHDPMRCGQSCASTGFSGGGRHSWCSAVYGLVDGRNFRGAGTLRRHRAHEDCMLPEPGTSGLPIPLPSVPELGQPLSVGHPLLVPG